ncbi:DUF3883 domain-containing protein [Arenibacter sp. M-2]|uniref:protein NO VEIN domain-containing protein n=1 Tax=Arenibacter sp. M-2 TaxID=3053612 RepID=UPI00257058EB|nr:DUF3883 domain-containing protein [Arenibacter sp. M-2]MDL5512114.1 DUF3883 domain-containing protein [Arenibacter sp. M-2]
MKYNPILFMRIAWMREYKGVTEDDIPSGAGSYVDENKDGGEVYNFMPHENRLYGYARMQSGRSINIDKLGAKGVNESIEGITVVFISKHPGTGGQYIVGWYKNATVYRTLQNIEHSNRGEHTSYNVLTESSNGKLILADDRVFSIPHGKKGWPGQTNVWYLPKTGKDSFLSKLKDYMSNPDTWIDRTRKKIPPLTGFQKDLEKRKEIEIAAMVKTAEYFSRRGFEVKDVCKLNYGWDLEAKKGEQTLLLEVKGLSGKFGEYGFDITPNEFAKSKKNRKHFRFCILSYALKLKSQQIDIFYYQDNSWRTIDVKQMKIEEIRSGKGLLIKENRKCNGNSAYTAKVKSK